jgi:hypothetical protein
MIKEGNAKIKDLTLSVMTAAAPAGYINIQYLTHSGSDITHARDSRR